MRHRVATKTLSRDTNARKMLIRGMVRSLVEHGKITTTVGKASLIARQADKLIGVAQKNTLAARRQLQEFFGTRDVANTLVDRIAPAMSDRTSGFTRIVPLGKRRGDNTLLVEIQLVADITGAGSLKKPAGMEKADKPVAKSKSATKKTAVKKEDQKPVKKTAKKAAKKAATKAVKKEVKK